MNYNKFVETMVEDLIRSKKIEDSYDTIRNYVEDAKEDSSYYDPEYDDDYGMISVLRIDNLIDEIYKYVYSKFDDIIIEYIDDKINNDPAGIMEMMVDKLGYNKIIDHILKYEHKDFTDMSKDEFYKYIEETYDPETNDFVFEFLYNQLNDDDIIYTILEELIDNYDYYHL